MAVSFVVYTVLVVRYIILQTRALDMVSWIAQARMQLPRQADDPSSWDLWAPAAPIFWVLILGVRSVSDKGG
jgi:hypothetical protein